MKKWLGKFYNQEDDETHYVSIEISCNKYIYIESQTACIDDIEDAISNGKLKSVLKRNALVELYELSKGEPTEEKGNKAIEILKTLDTLNGREFSNSLSTEANEEIIDRYGLTDNDLTTLQEWYGMQVDPDKLFGLYDDYEEVGRRETEYTDYEGWLENYIDFEQIGEDVVNDGDRFLELDNGKILEVEC